mmetsp:Transcript_107695/g.303363  ORF Transcript_107695/g.303363 Transcript_107695/m.303363 type:complete len:179 (+) Transcript_107695:58-594(+)
MVRCAQVARLFVVLAVVAFSSDNEFEELEDDSEEANGDSEPAVDFDENVPIVDAVDVADVRKEILAQAKPAIVIVTQSWCGACTYIKNDINSRDSIKELMKKFVVVHAEGEKGDQWQADGRVDDYIPRVYFFGLSGQHIPMHGESEKYEYFFNSAELMEKAMKEVLVQVGADNGQPEL